MRKLTPLRYASLLSFVIITIECNAQNLPKCSDIKAKCDAEIGTWKGFISADNSKRDTFCSKVAGIAADPEIRKYLFKECQDNYGYCSFYKITINGMKECLCNPKSSLFLIRLKNIHKCE